MQVVSKPITVDGSTRLRPIVADDAPAIFALVDANRLILREWQPWLDRSRSVGDIQTFSAGVIDQNLAGTGAVLVIESSGQPCGIVGFNVIVPGNRSGEIGYWLAESHQRRGIMSASVRRLTQFGFDELKLHRVSITAAVQNRRSRAIPERLGFRFEGTLRDAEWLYDHFVDHAFYARLSTDP